MQDDVSVLPACVVPDSVNKTSEALSAEVERRFHCSDDPAPVNLAQGGRRRPIGDVVP